MAKLLLVPGLLTAFLIQLDQLFGMAQQIVLVIGFSAFEQKGDGGRNIAVLIEG